MARHWLDGNLISPDYPLAVVAVSGGDGTTQHIIGGNTIDADHPLAVHDATAIPGVTDHGALTGLADNDHPQYQLAAAVTNPVGALVAGLKVAAGVHTQVAAADTVATGLATVLAVVVSFQTNPTREQLLATGTIGNQAGAPAAGSIIIKTWRGKESLVTSDAVADPEAAVDFSGAPKVAWMAIGT
jgi:hypothetical protein